MSVKFSKNGSITGKFKMLNTADGQFIDQETGEVIPVANMIQIAMEGQPFDMTVKASTDEEISVEATEE